MPTQSAVQALKILRDGSQFHMDNIKKQAATVGAIFAVDTVSLVLFGTMLGWL
jgi:hypothetical protein